MSKHRHKDTGTSSDTGTLAHTKAQMKSRKHRKRHTKTSTDTDGTTEINYKKNDIPFLTNCTSLTNTP